jgi:hypothetical protein
MKYKDAASFRHALEVRLKATASDDAVSVNRLRKTVSLERFLARLLKVTPERWLLKGGVALEFRLHNLARATKDLDLWMREGEETATDNLISATEVDLQDFFAFTIVQTHRLQNDSVGATIRYRLRAEVAGREFEIIIVDVALGGTADNGRELITGSNLLAFAEVEPIRVPALSLDQHVAEKLHAYTRIYASESSSSRVKDLIDLVLISSFAAFQVNRLRQALDRTFDSRGSHPLPPLFPQPPANWIQPYARLATDVAINDDLSAGHLMVARFLDPVLSMSVAETARWDPGRKAWH